ncbi:hypothetical protein [Kocuria marina]|uniref:hypothetical protein n=1 Tax=Kocuria marina TaxID=223184 RepID=UPI00345F3A8D
MGEWNHMQPNERLLRAQGKYANQAHTGFAPKSVLKIMELIEEEVLNRNLSNIDNYIVQLQKSVDECENHLLTSLREVSPASSRHLLGGEEDDQTEKKYKPSAEAPPFRGREQHGF